MSTFNTGYTVGSVDEIKKSSGIVQITMNGRISPPNRNYVRLMEQFNGSKDVKIMLHYDYINTVPRLFLINQGISKKYIDELVDIITADNENILGVVMHMDYPLSNEVYLKGKGLDRYNKPYYDFYLIKRYVGESDYPSLWKDSVLFLYERIKDALKAKGLDVKRKIYLENTTCVLRITTTPIIGGCNSIINIINDNEMSDVFGVCLDTEHHYAVYGKFPNTAAFQNRVKNRNIDYILHLNTIPQEVRDAYLNGKKYKDIHSDTTIAECSELSVEDYINIVNSMSCPIIREVKESARIREQQFISNL